MELHYYKYTYVERIDTFTFVTVDIVDILFILHGIWSVTVPLSQLVCYSSEAVKECVYF
jgi:hypothetical protein